MKEVSEDTILGMSVKTLITLGGALAIGVGGYYNLMAEIQEAKELPPPSITRVEYELKDELIRNAIMETQKQVEQISSDLKRIDERLYEISKK